VAKILSIDLGTTYFKISLFDRGGRLLNTCRIAPPLAGSPDGRLELLAEDFSKTIVQGIAELCVRVGGNLSDVEAVTIASQTNSFVLLDTNNEPLTPLILWPDRRALSLDGEAGTRCDLPEFSATVGFSRITFQCMAAKLLWLQEHSPDVWRRTRKLCLISDYFTLLFTGQHVTEAGAAGLTGLVDVHRCQWYPKMLARFGIEATHLPSIVRAGTDLGPIDPQAAKRFGLPESCRFIVGCLDQYAGAIGAGNVEPGIISETTGTVLATVRCSERFDAQGGPNVVQGPAFRQGLYWKMVFGEVSANYLEWYRAQLPDRPEFDRLTALSDTIEPGAEGLRLRTDAGLTCSAEVFDGLSAQHTRGHQVRCILEAVAFALKSQVAALTDGVPPCEIRCAGGAARSNLWLQIKANVLGTTMLATECPEPTSLGAAILAEAALTGTDVPNVARQWVRLKPPHRTDPQLHSQYRELQCI
jgi:xylulokinase